MKRFLSVAVLFSVLAVAGVASATTITLDEVGVNNSRAVYAYFGGAIQQRVNALAGYYQLSINGAEPVNGFCVDPAWSPSSPQEYDLRSINPSSVYAKAAYLFSLAETGQYAPSLIQVAIWETVMGNDFTLINPTTSFLNSVNALLAMAIPSTFDLSLYSLAVNTGISGNVGSGYGQGFQDYIIRNPNAPVPEPATMLLLGSGLAGLAAFRRRARK